MAKTPTEIDVLVEEKVKITGLPPEVIKDAVQRELAMPIRAGDVLILYLQKPKVHYRVGRVDEDGQQRFAFAASCRVKKNADHAIDLARDLVRSLGGTIFFKDVETGEWRQIAN